MSGYLVQGGVTPDDSVSTAKIQAAKDWYSDSSNSKTTYTNAVTIGKAYVA